MLFIMVAIVQSVVHISLNPGKSYQATMVIYYVKLRIEMDFSINLYSKKRLGAVNSALATPFVNTFRCHLIHLNRV